MTATHQAARDAVATIVANVASAQHNQKFVAVLQYLTADDALPEETAQRLLDICDNDLQAVIRTAKMLHKDFSLLITEAVMHAAIKIKKEH